MKSLVRVMIVVCLLGGALTALAVPTSDEVYRVAKSGDLHKADAMIEEVLAAYPKNAKAHFIKAQLDAKQGRINEARTELAVAEALSPNEAFAKASAVAQLKKELNKFSGDTALAQPIQHQGLQAKSGQDSHSSWSTWIVLIVIGLVIFAIFRARKRPQFQPANGGNLSQGYGAQGYGSQGYGGGQPNGGPGYPQAGGGMGSGIMGGLATGAAIGAGVVGGQMLMNKLLGDEHPTPETAHQNSESVQPASEWEEPQMVDNSYDMGGDNFGASDGGWDSGGDGGGDDWS